MVALLRASHFQPTLAVTAITTALAATAGRGVAGSVWVALAALSGQLSVGWGNDYLDRDRDRRGDRLDKPIVAGSVQARTVGIAAAVAAIACVPLSLLSGWRAGLVHVAAVGIAWLYNGRLKRTVASPIPYVLAFGSLPAFVTLGLPGHPWPPAWSVAAAALLGTGAHFVNAVPDIERDVRTETAGLPQRIGATASVLVAGVLLAIAAIVVAASVPDRGNVRDVALAAAACAGVVAVALLALTGHPRASWSLTLCVAALTVSMLMASGASLAP
ncbi:MAG TPA: UbiA family prenyltransferase [Acidimicrobiales bacterium]